MANDDWDGAVPMNKALKALATSVRPISASRVKTAAATALENVKVRRKFRGERGGYSFPFQNCTVLAFKDMFRIFSLQGHGLHLTLTSPGRPRSPCGLCLRFPAWLLWLLWFVAYFR